MLSSNRAQQAQLSENALTGKGGHVVMESRKRGAFMDISNTVNVMSAQTGRACAHV